MVPNFTAESYETVLVQGHSETGLFETRLEDNGLWIPILPMVWDSDVDAVTAIVVSAFLLLLPLQVLSHTFRDLRWRYKTIVIFWTCLLLAGTISSLIAVAYQLFHLFPQYRFCPPDTADILPMMNHGTLAEVPAWDEQHRYSWNRTIQDHFINKTPMNKSSTACLYPCLGVQWPLRDPTDIHTIDGLPHRPLLPLNTSYWIMLVAYVLVAASALSSLTVAIIKYAPGIIPQDFREVRLKQSWGQLRETYRAWRADTVSLRMLLLGIWIFSVSLYTWILTPAALVTIVGYQEYVMWTYDITGESFIHVGQWGTLAAALIVIIAATIPVVVARFRPEQEDPEAGRKSYGLLPSPNADSVSSEPKRNLTGVAVYPNQQDGRVKPSKAA
ncbi:hypothetical protein FQN53_002669 [Emmonsiellopsis sp. PD_33]|nr:hypothetical protein FQN53_002669 [Emmonsiellopsis sp. PD_33]